MSNNPLKIQKGKKMLYNIVVGCTIGYSIVFGIPHLLDILTAMRNNQPLARSELTRLFDTIWILSILGILTYN